MAWNDTKTEIVSKLHAADWNNMVASISTQGAANDTAPDYLIYKTDSTIYTKRAGTSTIIYTGSVFADAAQAASDDATNMSPVAVVNIKVIKPLSVADSYVIDKKISFAGKTVYFDGGGAVYNFSSYNGVCFEFCGTYSGLNGYTEGAMRNCLLYGSTVNTDSIFITSEHCGMFIENLDRARTGTTWYATRDCYAAIKLLDNCYINIIQNCRFHAIKPIEIGEVCNGTWIYNCNFGYMSAPWCISIAGGTPITIADNYFEDVQVPIVVTGGSNVSICNNYFSSSVMGISVGASEINISGNLFATSTSQSGYIGINIYDQYYCGTIHNNFFAGMGYQTTMTGIKVDRCNNLIISNNWIAAYLSGCVGIQLTGTVAALIIEGNNINGGVAAEAGIRGEVVNYSNITNNDIKDYPTAIDFTGGCTAVYINGNNLHDKSINAGTLPNRVFIGDTISTVLPQRAEFRGKISAYYDGTDYYAQLWDGTNSRRALMPLNEKTGAAAMTTASAAVTVTHALGIAPTKVLVTGTSADTTNLYVTGIGTSTFVINNTVTVSATTTVYWRAMG